MKAKVKSKGKSIWNKLVDYKLSMLEIVLALVVMVIGIVGIIGLFPVATERQNEALSSSYATDAAEQFLRFNKSKVEQDWNWLNVFANQKPNLTATGEVMGVNNSVMATNGMENWGEHAQIVFSTTNVEISPSVGFNPEVDNNNGLFLIKQKSPDGETDFTAALQCWKAMVKNADGKEVSAQLCVEVSWRAEQPYNARKKEIFCVEAFKTPELHVASTAMPTTDCTEDQTDTNHFNIEVTNVTAGSGSRIVTLTVTSKEVSNPAGLEKITVQSNPDAVTAISCSQNGATIVKGPDADTNVSGFTISGVSLGANGATESMTVTYEVPGTSVSDTRVATKAGYVASVDFTQATFERVYTCLGGAPANSAPVAADDTYSVTLGQTLIVNTPGVLANDTDADNDTLSVLGDSVIENFGSAGGIRVPDPMTDGAFTYEPTGTGTATFSYKASDGKNASNVGTVTINVVEETVVSDNYKITAMATEGGSISSPGETVLNAGEDASYTIEVSPGYQLSAVKVDGASISLGDSNSYEFNNVNANHTIVATFSPIPGVDLVNDAPVAVADTYTVNEDSILNGASVLNNDSDPDAGDTLTADLGTSVAHGTLTMFTNGTFTYTPVLNYNGSDSFTYRAKDAANTLSDEVTVTINVAPVADPEPIAVADSYSTMEDMAMGGASVLANDTNPDGGALTAILGTTTTHGSLVLDGNGSFVYTPSANYNGLDSFTYKAKNAANLLSSEVTVTINIAAVNDAPVAAADSYTTDEDTALSGASVLTNDTDVEGDALTAVLGTNVAHGTLTLGSNGTFSYTPVANYNGADSFTYTAKDAAGAQSNVVTVTLTVNAVNDAPVAAADSYITDEDIALSGASVLSNDSDVDAGDTLTAILGSSTTHGTLTLNSNGTFSYTPAANYYGSDSFTYTAKDSANAPSNVVTVTLTINAVNDAPVAVADSYTVNEDNTLTVAARGVLTNDTDIEQSPLSAIKASNPAHGTLAMTTDGGFTYSPAANWNGTDTFTYKANDGGLDSAVQTVTIVVNAVNDAPVAANDSYSVYEDNTLTVAAKGVLNNDTDIEGTTLTATVVSSPAHGTLSLNANGGFTFTPAANWNGTDSFTYKGSDGELNSENATVTVTVYAVNDAPVGTNDFYTTNEDNMLDISQPGVLSNDNDVDGDTLTTVGIQAPSHGTLVMKADGSIGYYIPDTNWYGTDYFYYEAYDGQENSRLITVAIAVGAVNDGPTAVADSYTVNEDNTLTVAVPGVLSNDTDTEGDSLIAIKVTNPANGTLTLDAGGSLTYIPAANWNGTDSFTYSAKDGAITSDPVTVTIRVNAVNDAPIANNASVTVTEDTPKSITLTGSDIEGSSLTYAIGNNPSKGTLTGSGSDRTYTPSLNATGSDSFTFKVNDGSADSAYATISITINPVNDAPSAVDDTLTINEDAAATTVSVLNNDSDIDGDTLTITAVSSPSKGTATRVDNNTKVSYTPNLNANGTDSFTYTISDGSATATATVNVTINPVNDAPTAVADNYSVNQGATLTGAATVLANDTDIDTGNNQGLTAVLVNSTSGLTFNSNGTFTYIPPTTFYGTATFSYKAQDSAGAQSNTVTVTITVNKIDYIITATAEPNGSISSPGSTTLNYGGAITYTITPTLGYNVGTVTVDGTAVAVTANNTYTFSNVTANHTINATFSNIIYTITATAGANGTVTPVGETDVNHGGSQTYTITPAEFFQVDTVTVDGTAVAVTGNNTYTFSNVTANHTINATFKLDTYDFDVNNGTITVNEPLCMTINLIGSEYISNTTSNKVWVRMTVGGTTIYPFATCDGSKWDGGTCTSINYTYGGTPYVHPLPPIDDKDVKFEAKSAGAQAGALGTNPKSGDAGIVILHHGDTMPSVPNGVADQTNASTFLRPYLDGNGKLDLGGANNLIVLIESGYNNSTSDTTFDLQDAVLLVTFSTCTGTSGSPNAGTTSSQTIAATASAHGKLETGVSPVSTVSAGTTQSYTVTTGSYKAFSFIPDTGYEVTNVVVDGVSEGVRDAYAFTNVKASHTLNVTFAVPTYTITASTAGITGGGTISPAGVTTVSSGSSQTYTITPSSGFVLQSLKVDGSSVTPTNNSYTISNVTANKTIIATFALCTSDSSTGTEINSGGVKTKFYCTYVNIRRSSSTSSSSSSAVQFTYTDGSTAIKSSLTIPGSGSTALTVNADSGKKIASLKASLGSSNAYGSSVSSDASCCSNLTITATAGTGGSISPSGNTTVLNGGSQSYTIAANAGYAIQDVKINGGSVGVVSSYNFTNVTANQTIEATFSVVTYNLTASRSGGNDSCTITPASKSVNYGSNQTYTINVGSGFRITDVKDNNVTMTLTTVSSTQYTATVSNVTAAHSIVATFATNNAPAFGTVASPLATWAKGTASNVARPSATDADGDTITYSLSGQPAWLSLSGSNLTGTPTASGTFNFTLTATDAYGTVGTKSLSITVTNTAPAFGTIASPVATWNKNSASSVARPTATDANGDSITYSLSGNPAWLSISGSNLAGTPTAVGTFTFTLTASDGSLSTPASLSIVVTNSAPAFGTIASPVATWTKNSASSVARPTATDANGDSITYSLSGNPAWLSISGSNLVGTPTAVGTFTFTLTASDGVVSTPTSVSICVEASTGSYVTVGSASVQFYCDYVLVRRSSSSSSSSSSKVKFTYTDNSTSESTGLTIPGSGSSPLTVSGNGKNIKSLQVQVGSSGSYNSTPVNSDSTCCQ